MLLQKTSWRIKQFLSHRRHNSPEESDTASPDQLSTDPESLINAPKRLSWLSQTSIERQPSPRRASSSATPRSHQSVVAVTTAHSSASSLCSCDCVVNAAPTITSLSKTNDVSRTPIEPFHLPCSTSKKTSGETKARKPVTSNFQPRSPTTYESNFCTDIATGSDTDIRLTFNLLEALTIDPNDDEKTPTQSLKDKEPADMIGVSENVERLIRETDQAFQAVGTALAEAKQATTKWYDNPRAAPTIQTLPATRSASRKHSRSIKSSQKSSAIKSTVGKGKKGTAKRKPGILGRAKVWRKPPPPPTNTPARWTLTEVTKNMADVSGETTFSTNVDDIVLLSSSEQVKQDKIDVTGRESIESSQSSETAGSTPTEPFHLESLSERIKVAQMANLTLQNSGDPIAELIAPSLGPQMPIRAKKKPNITLIASNIGMTVNDMIFPSPPRTPHRPCGSQNVPLLPTIPEISPLHISPTRSFTPRIEIPSRTLSITPSANFITLPCTPFTVTSPLFQHGKIRLSYIHPMRKDSSPEDSSLDRAAFQVAISGTLNEYRGDMIDEEQRKADELDLNELMKWWAGFGFASCGELVDEARAGSKENKSQSQSLITDLKFGPELQSTEARNILEKEAALLSEKIIVEDKNVGVDLGKLTVARRPSTVESLPPSPMLDLSYLSTIGGEAIPMGFNLGHDLDDFLNWETKNVQAFLRDE